MGLAGLPKYNPTEYDVPFAPHNPNANDEDKLFLPIEMEFHSSWDWLMPVVEKIDSILADDDFVTISYNRCLIEVNNTDILFPTKEIVRLPTIEGMGNSRIEATWNAVCEFIEWYNEQK